MLAAGATLERAITITPERTVDFLGEALRVYATSAMVYDVEMACRDLVRAHCSLGEDSVGTGIALSHQGSALAGTSVTIRVTVKRIEGRKVQFECLVRDALEVISQGEHGRFVIELERARVRLAAKRRKLDSDAAE